MRDTILDQDDRHILFRNRAIREQGGTISVRSLTHDIEDFFHYTADQSKHQDTIGRGDRCSYSLF